MTRPSVRSNVGEPKFDEQASWTRHTQALDLVHGYGKNWATGYMRNTLSDLARLGRNYVEAEDHYMGSLRDFEATKNANGRASATHNLGYVALHNGNGEVEPAAERFEVALSIFRDLGDRRGIAECLIGLAAVAAVRRQPERAARLAGIADRALHDLGAVQSQSNIADFEGYLALTRNEISEESCRAAWEQGWAMDLEEGATYALRDPHLVGSDA